MCFGRDVGEFGVTDKLRAEGWGFVRERWGEGRLFSGKIRGRRWLVLDRKERTSSPTVKEKHIARLSDLCHRLHLTTVLPDGYQVGDSGKIMVPEIVPEGLEMPEALARAGIQADDTIGEKVIAFAAAAVKIRRSRTSPDEYQATLFINGTAAPIICRPSVLPGIPFPGLTPEFSGLRDCVEAPEFLSAPNIESTRDPRIGPHACTP